MNERTVEQKRKDLEKARKELHRDKYKGLSINRIPAETREEFMSYAHRYHDGDYGQALQYVFDVAMKFVPQVEQLQHYIAELETRISSLEGKGEDREKRKIRTIGGNTLEA